MARAFVEDKTNVSIPLTLDWLTLTWLKVRLHLWWRRGRLSPRHWALLLLLGVFSGCVPVTRFEETQSAAQVELEGRRRAEYQLAELKLENGRLLAEAQRQARLLDERDQALSRAELDSSTRGKEREDAEGMVEQLRGELSRVGEHLRAFDADRQRLATALDVEATRGRALSRLARDAALALSEPLAVGEYTLDAERGAVVLRVPRDKVLSGDSAVRAEAETLLKAVSRILLVHKQSRLRVEDSSAQADPIAIRHLLLALGERGVSADRFEPLAATDDGEHASGSHEENGAAQIALGFSVP